MGTFGNQAKTLVLLGVLTGILIWIGGMMAGQFGLLLGLAISLVMNIGSYWFSDKIVLAMYKAKEIKDKNNPLVRMVKELSQDAKLPMPRVYIIPTEQANAFATGRDPKHSAVACTNGIMKILAKEELKGVLAHELSHVKNRDTLITTIAATIAGVISYIASMARYAAMFGGMGRDDNGKNNLFGLIVLTILAPIMALIIQLAISRSREYMADESGAKLAKDPRGLASALAKIEASVKNNPLRFGNAATSSLFISNPFSGQALLALFSTHPPTKERIKRLNDLKA